MLDWFSEKFIEDCLAEAPEHFLARPLKLLHQQPRIEGFIPDLIFESPSGEQVIVEVQQHALDRHHLYKCLEYRDSLDGTASVILVCESLPLRYERIAKTHDVEIVTFDRHRMIESAIINCPKSLANHILPSNNPQTPEEVFSNRAELRPYAWGDHDELIDVYRYTIAELARCGLLEKYRNDPQMSEIVHAAEDLLSGTREALVEPHRWNIDNLLGAPPGWVPPQEERIRRIRRPKASLRVLVTSKDNLSLRWEPTTRYSGTAHIFDWVRWPAAQGYAYDRPENELLFIHGINGIEVEADRLMHRSDGDEKAAVGSMMLALVFSMLQHLRKALRPIVDCEFDTEFRLELGEDVPTKSWWPRRRITGWRIVDAATLRVEEALSRVAEFEGKTTNFSVSEMLTALDLALLKPTKKLSTASAVAKQLRLAGTDVKAPVVEAVLRDLIQARDIRMAPYAGKLEAL